MSKCFAACLYHSTHHRQCESCSHSASLLVLSIFSCSSFNRYAVIAQPLEMVCIRAKLLWSCLTLCDPMVCSLLAYCVHGDSPGKISGVGCHALLLAKWCTCNKLIVLFFFFFPSILVNGGNRSQA